MATLPPWRIVQDVPFYIFPDGSIGWGLAGFDVDADGSGGNPEQDPDFQPTTTLKNPDGTSLNQRIEKIFVMPEDIAWESPGVVMGCQGQVTDVLAGLTTPAIPGELGPVGKVGEGSPALAQFFGVNPNPRTGGTQEPRFFYRIWPNKPGFCGGKQYQLQPMTRNPLL